jgi:DNA polymerase-3 subunit gamma/tau
MSYQVLARKWRPRNFAELVGQEHVVRALANALDHDRLHHAYLFTGTRGVGKTTLARILAKALNCETGVSSTPCGQCSSCREIEEGRFVDLLEVDAASRTKVDQTRELLEQVPYAPVRGRYKVYLIDEVHMFSDSSFNALLKTLEEPPPHVKFLLATTDPQKVPVTVLSRCLQFNLGRLSVEQIEAQFRHVLAAERIEAEVPAVALLARAADGSMRDGLSLLDQAIGYGGGALRSEETRGMLGVVAVDRLPDLLDAVDRADGAALLEAVDRMAQQAPDFGGLLRDLLTLLHRLAVVQAVPDAADPAWGDPEPIRRLAGRLAPEDVQLYYQIGLNGQRDLALAPDPRSGFEMTLLRMLAFRPVGGGQQEPVRRPAPAEPHPVPASPRTAPGDAPAQPPAPPERDPTDWHRVVPELRLGGMTLQLANHCSVRHWDGRQLRLDVDPSCQGLIGSKAEAGLTEALAAWLGQAVTLQLAARETANETPAQRAARQETARRESAVAAMRADPVVKAVEERFDAQLVEDSVRPNG